MNIVDCATKKGNNYDPYERITKLGGYSSKGRFSRTSEDMINRIESGKYSYYVDQDGKKVKIVVATRNGRKYLKTEADGFDPNNLLALGDCS